MVQGDARAIDMPAGVADAALLLGPLYHLALIDGFSSGFFADDRFREIVKRDLSSGQHRNPTESAEYFTTAYFHRPDELRAEIHDADFHDIEILGIEGPAWGAAAFRSALTDVAQRGTLLQMLAEIEGEPSIVGASAHLIAIARKH